MKKLMIAAAIVCAAAMSQAAATKWNSDPIVDHNGTTVGKNNVTAYCFEISATQYANYLTDYTAAQLSESLWGTYKTSLTSDKYDGMKASAGTGKANIESTKIDIGTAAPNNSKYAAIIYVDARAGAGNEWVMGNVGAIEDYAGVGDPTAEALALYLGGVQAKGATAWYNTAAVPEPTSAMLLLLGVAGLALRRRRA